MNLHGNKPIYYSSLLATIFTLNALAVADEGWTPVNTSLPRNPLKGEVHGFQAPINQSDTREESNIQNSAFGLEKEWWQANDNPLTDLESSDDGDVGMGNSAPLNSKMGDFSKNTPTQSSSGVLPPTTSHGMPALVPPRAAADQALLTQQFDLTGEENKNFYQNDNTLPISTFNYPYQSSLNSEANAIRENRQPMENGNPQNVALSSEGSEAAFLKPMAVNSVFSPISNARSPGGENKTDHGGLFHRLENKKRAEGDSITLQEKDNWMGRSSGNRKRSQNRKHDGNSFEIDVSDVTNKNGDLADTDSASTYWYSSGNPETDMEESSSDNNEPNQKIISHGNQILPDSSKLAWTPIPNSTPVSSGALLRPQLGAVGAPASGSTKPQVVQKPTQIGAGSNIRAENTSGRPSNLMALPARTPYESYPLEKPTRRGEKTKSGEKLFRLGEKSGKGDDRKSSSQSLRMSADSIEDFQDSAPRRKDRSKTSRKARSTDKPGRLLERKRNTDRNSTRRSRTSISGQKLTNKQLEGARFQTTQLPGEAPRLPANAKDDSMLQQLSAPNSGVPIAQKKPLDGTEIIAKAPLSIDGLQVDQTAAMRVQMLQRTMGEKAKRNLKEIPAGYNDISDMAKKEKGNSFKNEPKNDNDTKYLEVTGSDRTKQNLPHVHDGRRIQKAAPQKSINQQFIGDNTHKRLAQADPRNQLIPNGQALLNSFVQQFIPFPSPLGRSATGWLSFNGKLQTDDVEWYRPISRRGNTFSGIDVGETSVSGEASLRYGTSTLGNLLWENAGTMWITRNPQAATVTIDTASLPITAWRDLRQGSQEQGSGGYCSILGEDYNYGMAKFTPPESLAGSMLLRQLMESLPHGQHGIDTNQRQLQTQWGAEYSRYTIEGALQVIIAGYRRLLLVIDPSRSFAYIRGPDARGSQPLVDTLIISVLPTNFRRAEQLINAHKSPAMKYGTPLRNQPIIKEQASLPLPLPLPSHTTKDRDEEQLMQDIADEQLNPFHWPSTCDEVMATPVEQEREAMRLDPFFDDHKEW